MKLAWPPPDMYDFQVVARPIAATMAMQYTLQLDLDDHPSCRDVEGDVGTDLILVLMVLQIEDTGRGEDDLHETMGHQLLIPGNG